MCGFGGAGAFSDGKYNITNDFGGTLYEYIGKQKAVDLMKYVDEINMENGGEGTKLYSTAGTKFKKLCLQNKLKLLDASVRHLGTDINYVVLQNLYDQMKDHIDFILIHRLIQYRLLMVVIVSSAIRVNSTVINVSYPLDEAEANGWKGM